MTEELLITEIHFDKKIYPRENPSGVAITKYEEQLIAGEMSPPIVVKKIIYIENGVGVVRNAIIDGVHRYHSAIEFNKHSVKNKLQKIEKIAVVYLDDAVARSDDGIAMSDLILESARRNKLHGVPIKRGENEENAKRIYRLNKNCSQKEIASTFGVAQSTVSGWLAPLIAAENASENAVIMKLDKLGWKQEEIGEVVGLDQSNVSKRILGEISELINRIKSLLSDGQSPEKVAKDQQIDIQVVYAILFGDATDAARMSKLNCEPRPYDVWNFGDCNSLCGSTYPGRIPGQLVLQTLYFYTEPGALVVDPMGGSGTTVDACLLMGRKCRAFDCNPEQPRIDIITKDAIVGLSEMKQKADLIFLDPPYFKKVDDGYCDASISRRDANEYMAFFTEFATVAKKSLKAKGKLAFLMSDFIKWEPKDPESIFVHDYIKIFTDVGFTLERIIQCPLSSQQIHPDIINKYREGKQLAKISRSLVILG